MQHVSSNLLVGDSVRFVHATHRAPASTETVVVGEVAGINPGIATVDVMVVLGGRPTYLTKRPWELEKVEADEAPISRSRSG